MASSWSTEKTLQFIELYKNEPHIWNPKHKHHKEKDRIRDSWMKIAQAMGVSVTESKKKKESLMTSFRIHYKRKDISIKSGLEGEDIYRPKWVYYNALEDFLKDVYEYTSQLSTESKTSPCSEHNSEDSVNELLNTFTKVEQVNIPGRKRHMSDPLDFLGTPTHAETSMNNVLNDSQTEDECDLYAKLLATKLRRHSVREREEIMYEIDGVLLNRRRLQNQPEMTIKSSPSNASRSNFF